MVDLKPLPQPVGRQVASRVPWQRERFCNRCSEQRIAKRIQNERQRAFGDMVVKRNKELVAQWSKDPKHKVVQLSGDDEAGFNTTMAPVVSNWVAKDARHKQLLDALQQELGKIRSGS